MQFYTFDDVASFCLVTSLVTIFDVMFANHLLPNSTQPQQDMHSAVEQYSQSAWLRVLNLEAVVGYTRGCPFVIGEKLYTCHAGGLSWSSLAPQSTSF